MSRGILNVEARIAKGGRRKFLGWYRRGLSGGWVVRWKPGSGAPFADTDLPLARKVAGA